MLNVLSRSFANCHVLAAEPRAEKTSVLVAICADMKEEGLHSDIQKASLISDRIDIIKLALII